MDMTKFGGRRFILAMGCGIMTTVLQWYGKIDPTGGIYATIILGTVGAYIGGSTVEAVKGMNKQNETN
jgi:uncharacterized membrane protein YeaQ/YmgE (transglycosylase-associated protein family)